MPIYFKELEQLIIKWKKSFQLKTPTNEVGKYIYDEIRTKIDDTFSKELVDLFKKISIEDIVVNKEIIPRRTYGEFEEITNIKFQMNSKL